MKWNGNSFSGLRAGAGKSIQILSGLVLTVGVTGAALAGPTAASYPAEVSETQTVSAYKTASPAVVTIYAGNGAGAGVVVDSSCLVLTNQHVLGTPNHIELSLANSARKYQGKLIATTKNPADDLALVQVIGAESPCSPMRLGDSDRVEVGQQVLAIGNPFGLERTLTKGIISRIDMTKNRLQTDAAINPGNSGGPLLNAYGEMIGINQAIINPEGRSSAGIGFAIPVNVVKGFLMAYKTNDATQVSTVITRQRNYFEATRSTPALMPPVVQPFPASKRSTRAPGRRVMMPIEDQAGAVTARKVSQETDGPEAGVLGEWMSVWGRWTLSRPTTPVTDFWEEAGTQLSSLFWGRLAAPPSHEA
jgi:S1-C subfamily serine protease